MVIVIWIIRQAARHYCGIIMCSLLNLWCIGLSCRTWTQGRVNEEDTVEQVQLIDF